MKNMSFGKMMALFGGFVLLLVICAVVIIKMTAKAPQAPQVTTKKYTAPPRAARDEVRAQRAERQAGAAAADGAVPAPDAAGVQASPAATPANQLLAMPSGPGAAKPVVLADVKPHLSSLDASVGELNVRVAALENRQLAAAAAPRAATPRPVAHRMRSAAVQQRPAVAPAVVPTTPLPGYKALAVVGNRAWVSMPDGAEDSVSAGEPVPRARVRSLDKDTGMVITTSDQHIDPH